MDRLTYVYIVGLLFASAASAAPVYSIVPLGLDDLEHTRDDGFSLSSGGELNEAGQVRGFAPRYNGGSTNLGESAWFYDGENTINIGLTGSEHTGIGGKRVSWTTKLNEAGRVSGYSNRYKGGPAELGRSAWLFDGATTIDIGLTRSEHTRDDGYKFSDIGQLNENGQVHGYSNRYNGSVDLGRSAWLFNGVTTIDIGLTDGEHTRNDGYRFSATADASAGVEGANQLNEAGQVIGRSDRYSGGSADLGESAWLYNGATTIDIGLIGSEYTRNDGYNRNRPHRR